MPIFISAKFPSSSSALNSLRLMISAGWALHHEGRSFWLQGGSWHVSVQLYLDLPTRLDQQPQPRQQWRLLSDHGSKNEGQRVLQRDKCLSHILCSGRSRHDRLCWWVASTTFATFAAAQLWFSHIHGWLHPPNNAWTARNENGEQMHLKGLIRSRAGPQLPAFTVLVLGDNRHFLPESFLLRLHQLKHTPQRSITSQQEKGGWLQHIMNYEYSLLYYTNSL